MSKIQRIVFLIVAGVCVEYLIRVGFLIYPVVILAMIAVSFILDLIWRKYGKE